MLIALAVIWLAFTFLCGPVFISPGNLSNLFIQTVTVGIVACGMTLIIVTGNIDLSVGSVAGFAGAVAAVLQVRYGWGTAGSVLAAVGLTGTKAAVGFMTGSLGILSEAAHSGLDLIAAAVTYFAVRASGKPADPEHTYGHGKIENLSALIETALLLLTCVWIIREAAQRLFFEARAIEVNALCEPFIRRKALGHLENGRVAILAGGTGNPFFTTDTCAALRASELEADVLIKATKVDGVYSDDPEKHPNAKLFDKLSYEDLINKNLRIMNHSAVSLCRENNIPMIVLNIFKIGNITDALCGRKVGTLIC